MPLSFTSSLGKASPCPKGMCTHRPTSIRGTLIRIQHHHTRRAEEEEEVGRRRKEEGRRRGRKAEK